MSNQLENALNNVTDASQLREVLLREMAASGQIVRTQDDTFRGIRQPTPDAPPSASTFRFEKEIRFHPESGKRTLLIHANSQADLDALEAQILGY